MSLSTNKTIKLENLSFFGYHGVNEEERLNGQDFIINLCISYNMKPSDKINSCIDYILLYNFLKEKFNEKKFNLIESLGEKIILDINNQFNNIYYIKINIRKPSIIVDNNKDFINVELEYNK
tara:strand:+ start:659 stop:1024 length:366 start_codon:yes stop_codon:yes gene_type:complete